MYEGNHSPLFNEQVIKDIYDAHPHLYEDDKHGIKMTGTQRDNKRRCVLRLCSNRFSAFIGLVYGEDKFETIIFAQKGKKRREAEQKEAAAAKLRKTQHLCLEQETNSVNQTPKNEENPVVVERGQSDEDTCVATKNEDIPVVIETEDSNEGTCEATDDVERLMVRVYQNDNIVQIRNVIPIVHKIEGEIAAQSNCDHTDAVMSFYNNKNNVPYRTFIQKIHDVLVADKPIVGLIHKLNDTEDIFKTVSRLTT